MPKVVRYSRVRQRTRRRGHGWAGFIALGLMAAAAAAEFGPRAVGCNIKGNVSYNNGQRIYHLPGQEYYDKTVIDPRKGERWFCSEEEARQAGWRRARR